MTYQGKSYEELLNESLKDESTADQMYEYMAEILDKEGDADAAEMMRSIAVDEKKHYTMLSFLQTTRMQREEQGQYKGLSSFPKTYDGWTAIAEDIKRQRPYDADLRSQVNMHLGIIGGFEGGDKAASENWLAEKAVELGIR